MTEIPVNVRAAAAVLMEEADNDVNKAKALARQRLVDKRYEEIRTVLWQTAIDQEIDQLWRSGRYHRKREAQLGRHIPTPRMTPPRPVTSLSRQPSQPLTKGETSTPSPAMMSAVERHVTGFMCFEMPNGTQLADWTKRNLTDLGRKVISNGRSAMRTGGFFMAVAEMLPKDDSRVADVLVEADLERLYRQQGLLSA
jgi:hypothetical protein